MAAPRSIEATLLRGMAAVLMLSSAIIFAALFAIGYVQRAEAFERALADDLHAVANITQVFPDGDVYVNVEPEAEAEYLEGGTRFFELWDAASGESLDRSASLESLHAAFPRPARAGAEPRRIDTRLPDGRAVSLLALRMKANWGIDAEELARTHRRIADREVVLVVGRLRDEFAAALAPLGVACLGGAIALPLLAAAALAWRVPRALAPLNELGEAVAARGSEDLQPFGAAGVPELEPVVGKLDELMARIARARERERSFLANAAHELRTPLAELRALIDLAELEHADGALPAERLVAMREVAHRMSELIATFFQVARHQNAKAAPAAALDALALLRRAVDANAATAASRRLRWDFSGPDALAVRSHADLLRALVDNLVANAATHARAGSAIDVEAIAAPRPQLRIANDCAGADAPAQAPEAHAHLRHGLVVAQLYAQALGVELSTVRSNGRFAAAITWPAPPA
jgi:signal transduction histidine kinase